MVIFSTLKKEPLLILVLDALVVSVEKRALRDQHLAEIPTVDGLDDLRDDRAARIAVDRVE
jgi:hypothetical protein